MAQPKKSITSLFSSLRWIKGGRDSTTNLSFGVSIGVEREDVMEFLDDSRFSKGTSVLASFTHQMKMDDMT
jgi:hypothetical protein